MERVRRKATIDEQLAFNRRALDEVRDHLGSSTVVIYSMVFGMVDWQGTGVLFQLADKYFLLSCAHNLDRLALHNESLFLGPSVQGGELIRLENVKITTTPYPPGSDIMSLTMREEDQDDLGVCELRENIVSQLLPGKRFLRMTDIDQGQTHGPAVYTIIGYPSENSKQDWDKRLVYSTALPFTTWLYEGHLGNKKPHHFALDYSGRSQLEDGTVTEAPAPVGLSGCGIWRLADPKKTLEEWESSDVKLVGIQHSYSKKEGYLRGTSVGLCFGLIHAIYPELREALKIVCQG